MTDRSELISWIRGELVGPTVLLKEPAVAEFSETTFHDALAQRRGALVWKPSPGCDLQEVLYYDRESPHRKYGAGLLHPASASPTPFDEVAAAAVDPIGADLSPVETEAAEAADIDEEPGDADQEQTGQNPPDDDFEVTSPDIRWPSSIGISFCAAFSADSLLVINLPQTRTFHWQARGANPVPVNGRYEQCVRHWKDENGTAREGPMWRRHPVAAANTQVAFRASEFSHGKRVRKVLDTPVNSPVRLAVEVFPRKIASADNRWLLTVVLRNESIPNTKTETRHGTLYQAFFEASIESGEFAPYPESKRPFAQLDSEEQSLALLYHDSRTWAIGHGCAAGWDTDTTNSPTQIFADVMPAVELPSMTPDVVDSNGAAISMSMRALAGLADSGQSDAWASLDKLVAEYEGWISQRSKEVKQLPEQLRPVAEHHLSQCEACCERMKAGIELLRSSPSARYAFRMANLAMLLQQIATKQLKRRELVWRSDMKLIVPEDDYRSPFAIYKDGNESPKVGSWRAFQVAFLLASLEGVANEDSADREIVDLIWFPTGGGKTEAYLAVISFYMFYQRLVMEADEVPRRDGVNVLMRYTLRMLTTQQFQRAAALIAAMEYIRRDSSSSGSASIPGGRFSLGIWLGRDGSPNKITHARTQLNQLRRGYIDGNPLILTECPWCRAAIGRYEGSKPTSRPAISDSQWQAMRVRGITDIKTEGPLLHCSDAKCDFGKSDAQGWLPIEVVDERIYRYPPSFVIATADKFAILAYRPEAGILFGRRVTDTDIIQAYAPPGLIVQDELHLISGPLGTMYALYESIFEEMCIIRKGDTTVKPKLIASTATIRGADQQVRALFGREKTSLFPVPGLQMGDSFFGRYARKDDGTLENGRLYLGVHANDYGSILTAQVRAFSSSMFMPSQLPPERRDPWWTLLAFYNSIRELGGAKTLFDSDIRSRLKFLFNREGYDSNNRRHIRIVEELTSRLSQSEIVGMLDRLSAEYSNLEAFSTIDACLASNIIEVGVDIDRLSLMAVVGQPKTTATYIQVTGRVGRRWWERPGLILMIYNPSKSRDRSHFEQFYGYHRRLYERVEPTTATPFATSAIRRALGGAILTWARQNANGPVYSYASYATEIHRAYELLVYRCALVLADQDPSRSLKEIKDITEELRKKWKHNPQQWERYPQQADEEYLMLWPGQFATRVQKDRGMVIPSSMRQVDGSAELTITQAYTIDPTDHSMDN